MRHLFAPQSEDAKGRAVAGVTYTVYPYNQAAAWYSRAASGEWTVNLGAAPGAATLWASPDQGVTTQAPTLTSIADGTVPLAYLDPGLYTVVGQVTGRTFVIPQYRAGEVITAAIGVNAIGVTFEQVMSNHESRLAALEGSTLEVYGQYIDAFTAYSVLPTLGSTIAGTDQTVSAGDVADVQNDTVGTGTVDEPQYPRGLYRISAGGVWQLKQRAGDYDVPDEFLSQSGPYTVGAAAPAGAKYGLDIDTGTEYYVDGNGNWQLKPGQAADNTTMTFAL